MGVIQDHIFGIRVTVQALLAGKYLKYFIPGVLAALIYIYFHNSILDAQESSEDVPLVGGIFSWALDFVDGFVREALKFLVIVLLSPFNCLLSEKFDTQLTGKTFDGGLVRMINDLLRTILIVIFALALEYMFLALWWVLGIFIPDVLENAIDPVIRFAISSFFFGFAFYDFSLERYGIGNLASWGFAFKKYGYMIATGALFTLMMEIPLGLGAFIATTLITMTATATYVKMKDLTLPTA